MLEIFKDIKDYEGLYQVSNFGRVKSLGRNIIVKPAIHREYYSICLHKESKRKTVYIHRLVAEAFIPNYNNLPQVNHKDENKLNNCVDNLEWCTPKYNANYGTAIERTRKKLINHPNKSIPIKCLDLETNEVKYYPSIIEAARQFNTA